MKKLQDKVAIVTGATSGIGLGIAKKYAAEGAKVVFCGRRADKGAEIEKEIIAQGGVAKFVRADCSVDADVENLIAVTVQTFGKIDILVNNAGLLRNFKLEEMNMATDYDAVFNLNVRSYFLTSKLAINHMLKENSGIIINIASIGALNGGPNIASYCSSKGAVVQLTRSLAKEFGGRGIRANAISPGLIYSEMMPKGAAFTDAAVAMVPLGRGGEPEEIANCAVFLSCDDSSFCNGLNLVVDGGASA